VLGAADHVVIVKDRDVVAARFAMAAEDVVPLELIEEMARVDRAFGQHGEPRGRVADVERRVEIATEDFQIVARHLRSAGRFSDEQEILLADRLRIFADAAAEVARSFAGDA
jgi:hypothetical protein